LNIAQAAAVNLFLGKRRFVIDDYITLCLRYLLRSLVAGNAHLLVLFLLELLGLFLDSSHRVEGCLPALIVKCCANTAVMLCLRLQVFKFGLCRHQVLALFFRPALYTLFASVNWHLLETEELSFLLESVIVCKQVGGSFTFFVCRLFQFALGFPYLFLCGLDVLGQFSLNVRDNLLFLLVARLQVSVSL
jgi:hypothetical protein